MGVKADLIALMMAGRLPAETAAAVGDSQRDKMGKNEAAAALGALGGKSKSAAKTAASKANGSKGGRPKKSSK